MKQAIDCSNTPPPRENFLKCNNCYIIVPYVKYTLYRYQADCKKCISGQMMHDYWHGWKKIDKIKREKNRLKRERKKGK